MRAVAKTDIGQIRSINQDYVKVIHKNDNECLAILCDGMGGHNAGEVASALACEKIASLYKEEDNLYDEVSIRIWLYQAIMEAHSIVFEQASSHEEYEGMGTTVVVALVKDGYVYISHVGDSRAYMLDDELIQLTSDDTLVNALLHAGTISKEEALSHPKKNVLLQAVGVSDAIHPSFIVREFNGLLLLCSDGLYNSLSLSQMKDILDDDRDIDVICDRLIEQANIYGGYDNIGVVLVEGGCSYE